jgi:transcriptional regulator with XRE-family HTH domain
MSAIANALRRELRDPEYSEGYAESFLNSYVATQIKVLREQRKMSQPQVAALIGTSQPGISRIENVNYSSWNIGTLKKLARAFHVRLKVSFEPYGTLPYDVENFSRDSLQRPPRESDPGLSDVKLGERVVAESPQPSLLLASQVITGNVFYVGAGFSTSQMTKSDAAIGASFVGVNSIFYLDENLAAIAPPQPPFLIQHSQDKGAIGVSPIQQGLARVA